MFGQIQMILAAVAIALIVGLGWGLKHEIEVAGAEHEARAVAQKIADENAAQVEQIKADSAAAMKAVTAELATERARQIQTTTIVRTIHDAHSQGPSACNEDAPVAPGGAGDAVYLCLRDPGRCTPGQGGQGDGAGAPVGPGRSAAPAAPRSMDAARRL